MSTPLGEGPRLIRPVAPTAWIDPRSATRGLKNQNHFFLLRAERERQHHTRETGSRSSGPLQGTPSRADRSRVKTKRTFHLLTTSRRGPHSGGAVGQRTDRGRVSGHGL